MESLLLRNCLVVNICLAQLSFLLKYSYKYLTVFKLGIIPLFSKTGGGCCNLRVKVVIISFAILINGILLDFMKYLNCDNEFISNFCKYLGS
jgi:hypothetical protein